ARWGLAELDGNSIPCGFCLLREWSRSVCITGHLRWSILVGSAPLPWPAGVVVPTVSGCKMRRRKLDDCKADFDDLIRLRVYCACGSPEWYLEANKWRQKAKPAASPRLYHSHFQTI